MGVALLDIYFAGGIVEMIILYMPWESKTKQRMVFRMIHVKDSLLPMGKVWSLDFLGMGIDSKISMRLGI